MFHSVFKALKKSSSQFGNKSLSVQCLSLAILSEEHLEEWLQEAHKSLNKWLPSNIEDMVFNNLWFEKGFSSLEAILPGHHSFKEQMYIAWLNHLIEHDALFTVCRKAFISEQWKHDPEFVLANYSMADIKLKITSITHTNLPYMLQHKELKSVLTHHISQGNIQHLIKTWEENCVFKPQDIYWLKTLNSIKINEKDFKTVSLENSDLTLFLIGLCFKRNKASLLPHYKKRLFDNGMSESEWFNLCVQGIQESVTKKERYRCLLNHKELFDEGHQFIIGTLEKMETTHSLRWDMLLDQNQLDIPKEECELLI